MIERAAALFSRAFCYVGLLQDRRAKWISDRDYSGLLQDRVVSIRLSGSFPSKFVHISMID